MPAGQKHTKIETTAGRTSPKGRQCQNGGGGRKVHASCINLGPCIFRKACGVKRQFFVMAVRKVGQKTRKSWSFENCQQSNQNTTHFFIIYCPRAARFRIKKHKEGISHENKASPKNGLIVRMSSTLLCGFQKMQNVRNGEYGLMSNMQFAIY